MDTQLADLAAKMRMSEKDLSDFLKRHHRYMVQGILEYEDVDGPNTSSARVYANWSLFHKLLDLLAGKPAVAEQKPSAVDPFADIHPSKLPTAEDIDSFLNPPQKKTFPPPPPDDE